MHPKVLFLWNMTMATALTSLLTRFTDKCNKVLAGGVVKTYEPNSLTPKVSYQDPEGTIPNLPEVVLDETGRAKIYLLGDYRVQVYSNDGTLIEDNLLVEQALVQRDFDSLSIDIQQQVEEAAQKLENTGGIISVPTLTALQAITPEYDYQLARVDATGDEYRWNPALTTTVKWEPTGRNFLSESKSYVDQKAKLTTNTNIVDQKDANSLSVFIIDRFGKIYTVGLDGSIQDNIKQVLQSVSNIDQTIAKESLNSLALDLKGFNGNSFLKIDARGEIYTTRLNGKSLQDILIELLTQTKTSLAVNVSGEFCVGKALYAELPQGFLALNYQWYRDGVAISGAIKSFYVLTSDDLFKAITVEATVISGGYDSCDGSGVTIGGIALESAGATGSIYEGYTLSAGDDFTKLDILTPQNPLGRWFTTRTYLSAPRGSDTLLGTMYDVDPAFTGFNDSNRGVPVGYDNMFVKNSILTLNARKATDNEKKHFQGTTRNEIASMLSSIGAFSMYAGDANGGENILEWRVRFTLAERNPAGWHPTLWTQSSLPSVVYSSNEWDVTEGNSKSSHTNYNEWGPDGTRTTGSSYGSLTLYDEKWHVVTAKFSHTNVMIYIDGVLNQTIARDANNYNEPAYALMTNHIYNGVFDGENYSKAQWDSLTKGATIEIDFVRLWRRTSKSHIKPLIAVQSVNIASGATGTITLPSKSSLWGRTDVLEHVQAVMSEENEPAGSHTTAYNTLPSFVTYNSTTRQITIDTANQKSGRLNFVIYGYLQDGSTSEPARTYVNVGPQITVNSINLNNGSSFDLYAVCDCGVLVTDGAKRTKVISVSGLPTGATYNDETGFLYVNAAIAGTYSIQVICINSAGQSVAKTVSLTIA